MMQKLLRRRTNGLTLIEILIVVTIVAALAALAYPSYTKQMQKTRRTAAQEDLLELAQFMERVYTENKSFLISGSAPSLPYTESPKDSSTKYYDLALQAGTTATAYTLVATPKDPGPQADNGIVTLDNLGVRCWDKDNDANACEAGETWN